MHFYMRIAVLAARPVEDYLDFDIQTAPDTNSK